MLILWTLDSCHTVHPSCHPKCYLRSFDHWPAKAAAHTAAMAAFDWARPQVQKFLIEDRKRWRYIRCTAKSRQKKPGKDHTSPFKGTFESMIFSPSVGYVTMEGNLFSATVYTTWNLTNRYQKMMPCLIRRFDTYIFLPTHHCWVSIPLDTQ